MTCEICQLSEDRHRAPHQAYAAGIGVHDYRPQVTGPFPVTDMDRLARERREAGLDEGGQLLPASSDPSIQRPIWVPTDDGGLTQEWVEETPSDRLPPGARTVSVRLPAGGTPRPQPEPAREPFAGTAFDPAMEAVPRTPEQLAAVEEQLRAMGDQLPNSKRGIIRRILNARKASS